MPAQRPPQPTSTPAMKKVVTTEKTIVTFRMPVDLGDTGAERKRKPEGSRSTRSR
jgi:hypothetical protein